MPPVVPSRSADKRSCGEPDSNRTGHTTAERGGSLLISRPVFSDWRRGINVSVYLRPLTNNSAAAESSGLIQ